MHTDQQIQDFLLVNCFIKFIYQKIKGGGDVNFEIAGYNQRLSAKTLGTTYIGESGSLVDYEDGGSAKNLSKTDGKNIIILNQTIEYPTIGYLQKCKYFLVCMTEFSYKPKNKKYRLSNKDKKQLLLSNNSWYDVSQKSGYVVQKNNCALYTFNEQNNINNNINEDIYKCIYAITTDIDKLKILDNSIKKGKRGTYIIDLDFNNHCDNITELTVKINSNQYFFPDIIYNNLNTINPHEQLNYIRNNQYVQIEQIFQHYKNNNLFEILERKNMSEFLQLHNNKQNKSISKITKIKSTQPNKKLTPNQANALIEQLYNNEN